MQAAPEHALERGGHVTQAEDDPRVGEDDEDDAGDGDAEQGQVHVCVYAHVYTRESSGESPLTWYVKSSIQDNAVARVAHVSHCLSLTDSPT